MIAEGEVLQLMNSGNPDLDEAAYLAVIQRKTAKLFEAAGATRRQCWASAAEREAALARYGMHLGTSFQLVDDVLDYQGDRTRSARTWATILRKAKMTLPCSSAPPGRAAPAEAELAAIQTGDIERQCFDLIEAAVSHAEGRGLGSWRCATCHEPLGSLRVDGER